MGLQTSLLRLVSIVLMPQSKSFKAYVYSLRNEVVELAPAGWKLADVEDSEVFEKLASQNLSPLDFL